MAQIKLFGEEANKIVANIPKNYISLFGDEANKRVESVKKKEKVPKMRKGLITINYLDSKDNPLCVDFEGFQDGSGCPCKDEEDSRLKQRGVDKFSSKHKQELINSLKMFEEFLK